MTSPTTNRPLSPHLLNYRWPLTVLCSGTHRITGILLSIGTVLFVFWLGSAAYGPAAYDFASSLFSSPIGYLVLFGYTFALYYHLCAGTRHLLWDVGKGFDLATCAWSNYAVIGAALFFTVVTWAAALIF